MNNDRTIWYAVIDDDDHTSATPHNAYKDALCESLEAGHAAVRLARFTIEDDAKASELVSA